MGVDQWAALASVDQWEHMVRTNRIIQAYVTQCQVVHMDNKLLSQQDQPKQKVMTSNLTTQALMVQIYLEGIKGSLLSISRYCDAGCTAMCNDSVVFTVELSNNVVFRGGMSSTSYIVEFWNPSRVI